MHFDAPVLLYGAGREARSTRAFLAATQPELKVYVTVDSGPAEIDNAEQIAPDDLPAAIAEKQFGLMVKSPGVSLYKPIFAQASAAGVTVTSNVNLWAAAFAPGRTVIALTGTKGKSTTATLVHAMLAASGVDVGLAGNVGVAPLDMADQHQTVVLELSSYQTADMDFIPNIAGITNLYPEHVDWHGTVARYFEDKLHLIDRDGPMRIGLGAAAKNNALVAQALGNPERLLPELSTSHNATITQAVSLSRLKGAHNLDNARLAAQIALAAGATLAGVLAGISAFMPLPHRLEEHRVGGTIFVNDSISTTPEATKAALAAYHGKRIALIAGGHEREQDYAELATLLVGYGVTTLACLPVTGERLARAAQKAAPDLIVLSAPDLPSAMQDLLTRRADFDTVILSPGAPSYNQFKNFEERGRMFVALAEKLFGGTGLS